MIKRPFCILGVGISIILSLLILWRCLQPAFYPGAPHYIAHAGGVVDSHKYTNSLEAVTKSIEKGADYIELDFCLTTDSVLICAHDWATYHTMTGQDGADHAIPLREFMSRKICGYLTPLSAYDVDSILACNPDLYLVTDKISSPELISRYFGKYKDRLVIECFDYNDYTYFCREDYFLPMISGIPDWRTYIMQHLHHLFNSEYTLGEFFCFDIKDYEKYCRFLLLPPIDIAVFSCENRHEADSIFALSDRIKFVYINNVE